MVKDKIEEFLVKKFGLHPVSVLIIFGCCTVVWTCIISSIEDGEASVFRIVLGIAGIVVILAVLIIQGLINKWKQVREAEKRNAEDNPVERFVRTIIACVGMFFIGALTVFFFRSVFSITKETAEDEYSNQIVYETKFNETLTEVFSSDFIEGEDTPLTLPKVRAEKQSLRNGSINLSVEYHYVNNRGDEQYTLTLTLDGFIKKQQYQLHDKGKKLPSTFEFQFRSGGKNYVAKEDVKKSDATLNIFYISEDLTRYQGYLYIRAQKIRPFWFFWTKLEKEWITVKGSFDFTLDPEESEQTAPYSSFEYDYKGTPLFKSVTEEITFEYLGSDNVKEDESYTREQKIRLMLDEIYARYDCKFNETVQAYFLSSLDGYKGNGKSANDFNLETELTLNPDTELYNAITICIYEYEHFSDYDYGAIGATRKDKEQTLWREEMYRSRPGLQEIFSRHPEVHIENYLY